MSYPGWKCATRNNDTDQDPPCLHVWLCSHEMGVQPCLQDSRPGVLVLGLRRQLLRKIDLGMVRGCCTQPPLASPEATRSSFAWRFSAEQLSSEFSCTFTGVFGLDQQAK